jgi:hypothetical protein
MFSLVLDTDRVPTGSKGRSLPILYWGQTAVFADRSPGVVAQRLAEMADALLHADDIARYFLHPCSLEGRIGLYGRDVFNRSGYRRRLERHGVVFASDPLARLTADGTFYCQDWGRFSPEFVILGNDAEDPQEVAETTPALLLWDLVGRRLGRVATWELARLAQLSRRTRAVSSGDASALVASI